MISAVLPACIPPFTNVCVLSFTALVIGLIAFRAGTATSDPTAANPNAKPARFWLWAAAYMLFVTALVAGLLGLALATGLVNWY